MESSAIALRNIEYISQCLLCIKPTILVVTLITACSYQEFSYDYKSLRAMVLSQWKMAVYSSYLIYGTTDSAIFTA